MATYQLVTLMVGVALAALMVRWAIIETRRDTKLGRFPLITGPLGGGTWIVVALAFVIVVPVASAVFVFELVPRGEPLLFAVMLGWLSTAFVAAIIAGVAIQVRRNAIGWLTLLGEDSLRVDVEGATATLKLQAGGARLYWIADAPQYVQFVIHDEATTATFWGMVSLGGLKDVTEGRTVEAQGGMLAGSAEPLRRWLAPFIARG